MSDHQPLRGDETGVMDAGARRGWDLHTDVVVIGLGGAGGSAAVEARAHGAEVVLLDRFGGGGATGKSAGAVYFGGGTHLQQRFGYEDSPRNMYEYLRLETGDVVSEEVLRSFCETSVENFEWLRAMGCPFPVSGKVVKTALPPRIARSTSRATSCARPTPTTPRRRLAVIVRSAVGSPGTW